ncbi:hypothetical protein QFZ31_001146 [Neobacillus niacini]|uniref:hypothetical protein n=1 Tax=Neobacillus driksii TaxID=3035913 RepID=UPI0027828629|nr:hypothetical protein [Neobacillus niacini]MDQ0971268.1 hypothetical protein [Neobacillus niacini]
MKEILEFYDKEEGEKLLNYSFVNSILKATFEITPIKVPAKNLAVRRYRQLSDELVQHEGWEVLEVSYMNIGTISMNRNEKEPNKNGGYFPKKKIEERLR